MNEEVIKLEDIFYSLKQRWKMIVLVTLISTLVAGIFSFFIIKPTYQGKVKLFIGKEEVAGSGQEYNNNDVMMYQKLMKTYAEIIKTKDTTKKALNSIGKDTGSENVERVLSGLTVSPSADTQILELTYKTKDKEEIVTVLNALTNTFMSESKDLIPNGNIKVIQAVEQPKSPVAPNKTMNIAIGFLLGLMVSVGVAFLLEYLDNTFKGVDELEGILELPVIGAIPNLEEKKRRKK